MKAAPLEAVLDRAPSAATWNALVKYFDSAPDARKGDVDRALRALEAWPERVPRPLPYYWLLRLVRSSFAPARLANALCLSDRWALTGGVSLDRFVTLTRTQLARLGATRDLPSLRVVDASYQSEGNPYSPGTMLDDAPSRVEFLRAPLFDRVAGLDLSGQSIDAGDLCALVRERPALRALSLVASGVDWDTEWAVVLGGGALAQLERLDLGTALNEAVALRALLNSTHLGGLRELRCELDASSLEAQGIGHDDFEALLSAARLRGTVKSALRARYDDPAWVEPLGGLFARYFPGKLGAHVAPPA